MKKFFLMMLLACVSFVTSHAQDDYSFIDNVKENNEKEVLSVDSSATISFDGSWCTIVVNYNIDTDNLTKVNQVSSVGSFMGGGKFSNGTSSTKYQVEYAVYKEKNLLKRKELNMLDIVGKTVKFRCSGGLAPMGNLKFKSNSRKGDILVLFIPEKDNANRKIIFKVEDLLKKKLL